MCKLRISCGYQIFRRPRDSPLPRRRPRINNLEWALLADGVAPADVCNTLSTDEGVARALAKLDTVPELRPDNPDCHPSSKVTARRLRYVRQMPLRT